MRVIGTPLKGVLGTGGAMGALVARKALGVNVGQVIRFDLDGDVLERRVVLTAFDHTQEISQASPVGAFIARAAAGEQAWVNTGAETCLLVKVLSVGFDPTEGSVAPVGA